MIFNNGRDLFFPNNEQQLILRAALLDWEQAFDAWKQWRAKVDIEKLDGESHHLLCLLYRNLSINQVEDTELARIKGVYKRTWFSNQLLIKKLQSVLQGLQSVDVKAIVLDDAALLARYYRDSGERPIYNYKLLVHPTDVEKTIICLQKLGWITDVETANYLDSPWVGNMNFYDSSSQYLSVSSHLFWATPQEYTDNQLWNYAVKSEIGEFSSYTLSQTDQLLYISKQAFLKSKTLQIPFLADAMMIINTSNGEIDWIRLVNQAQRYELILPLRNMLILLEEIFNIEFPNWVIPSLKKMAISHKELLQHQVFWDNYLLFIKAYLLRIWQSLKSYKYKFSRLGLPLQQPGSNTL